MAQQVYADHEMVALIHFNMGTYFRNGDPACNADNWEDASHDPAAFDPYLLDTDQWAAVLDGWGARHAVLTAKHGCGFLLWPSGVPIPAGPKGGLPYSYAVGSDLLGRFVDSFRRRGLGVGFYYSIKNNFFLNRKDHKEVNGTLLKYQISVTDKDYDELVLGHLRELWTNYGNLTEHWFDGGYPPSLQDRLAQLLRETQPDMVVWGGHGISNSSIAWVGTESGHPDGTDVWSTGCAVGTYTGHPDDPEWCPKGCDTTLQDNDLWFYEPTAGIRSLATLMDIYHRTVGRNGVLELDVAVDRTGQIRYDHARRYQEMGDYIRHCYGQPIFRAADQRGYVIELELAPTLTDRVWLREDQWQGGQRVRQYKVYVRTTAASSEWTLFSQGHSIGNKRIDRGTVWTITAIRIHVEIAADIPWFREIAIFAPCPDPKEFPSLMDSKQEVVVT